MIFRTENWKTAVFGFALGFVLLVGLTYASTPGTPQIKADEKSKVSGTIVGRSGDLVQVKDKKTGQLVVVSISDNTYVWNCYLSSHHCCSRWWNADCLQIQ